jgi:hypothetical protein
MNMGLFDYGKEKMCFIETDIRPYNNDLDALPFPDYSGFGIEKILSKTASTLSMNESGAISILTSRSCPFLCTFCFHTTGNRYRIRSLDNVFSEIDYLIKTYNLKYLSIVDESFGSNKQRVKEFCERIKVYGVKYRVQFRVTDMTKEIAETLKSSDCDCVCFGMESADNTVLKSMKKGITIEQIEEAIKICDDARLSISGGFIFGDIEETLISAKRTLKWWMDHKEYGFVLNFITTYPGTYLYRYALKEGIIKDEVKFIKDGCPMINVSKLTNTDIEWIAEQINNLQGRQLTEPNNISNIVFDCLDGTISFDFKCEKCKKHNHVEKVRIFVSRNIANCKSCGKAYAVPFPDIVITLIDKNIEKLLIKNCNIAIWPMTERFSFCFDRLQSLQNDSVYLIDNSKLKQNSKLSGKNINNPEIILQKNIEVVIIPPTPHLSAIEAQIRRQFKKIKRIINLEYLCKENAYYDSARSL